jgi:hypothetical protein
MTMQAAGDRVQLVLAGTLASPAPLWRGGIGTLIVTGLSGTPNFEMSPDDGTTWITVKETGTNTPISAIAAANAWNFILPQCRIRLSAGGGSMNAFAVGI